MFKPIEVDLLQLMDMLEDAYSDTAVRWSALRELLETQKAAQHRASRVVCTCGTGNTVPAEAHDHDCAIFASH